MPITLSGMSGSVLIETYWNVNSDAYVDFCLGQLVLIETYSNVNSFNDVDIIHLYFSINRNILECK